MIIPRGKRIGFETKAMADEAMRELGGDAIRLDDTHIRPMVATYFGPLAKAHPAASEIPAPAIGSLKDLAA